MKTHFAPFVSLRGRISKKKTFFVNSYIIELRSFPILREFKRGEKRGDLPGIQACLCIERAQRGERERERERERAWPLAGWLAAGGLLLLLLSRDLFFFLRTLFPISFSFFLYSNNQEASIACKYTQETAILER